MALIGSPFGEASKAVLLQILEVKSPIVGTGLIVWIKLNVLPVQPFAIGVIIYFAIALESVTLIKVPLILDTGVNLDNPPVILFKGISGVFQVYNVPGIELAGITEKGEPLQLDWTISGTEGSGLTVTYNWKSGPIQPFVLGVMVYMAVAVSAVFTNVWLIIFAGKDWELPLDSLAFCGYEGKFQV